MTKDDSWLPRLGLLALCGAYLVAAFGTLADVRGLATDLRELGMPAPGVITAVTLATLLVAPALVVLFPGAGRRIGAWWLAAFTLAAGLLAHQFWSIPADIDRLPTLQAFLGHVALAGGFVYVAGRAREA